MAVHGEISARRVRAVWRQQVRERRLLPDDLPDSPVVAAAVAPAEIRAATARVTRRWGPTWEVVMPGRTARIRSSDLR